MRGRAGSELLRIGHRSYCNARTQGRVQQLPRLHAKDLRQRFDVLEGRIAAGDEVAADGGAANAQSHGLGGPLDAGARRWMAGLLRKASQVRGQNFKCAHVA